MASVISRRSCAIVSATHYTSRWIRFDGLDASQHFSGNYALHIPPYTNHELHLMQVWFCLMLCKCALVCPVSFAYQVQVQAQTPFLICSDQFTQPPKNGASWTVVSCRRLGCVDVPSWSVYVGSIRPILTAHNPTSNLYKMADSKPLSQFTCCQVWTSYETGTQMLIVNA